LIISRVQVGLELFKRRIKLGSRACVNVSRKACKKPKSFVLLLQILRVFGKHSF